MGGGEEGGELGRGGEGRWREKGGMERGRGREKGRQTDRQRLSHRERDRDRETETDRQTDRKRETETGREKERCTLIGTISKPCCSKSCTEPVPATSTVNYLAVPTEIQTHCSNFLIRLKTSLFDTAVVYTK